MPGWSPRIRALKTAGLPWSASPETVGATTARLIDIVHAPSPHHPAVDRRRCARHPATDRLLRCLRRRDHRHDVIRQQSQRDRRAGRQTVAAIHALLPTQPAKLARLFHRGEALQMGTPPDQIGHAVTRPTNTNLIATEWLAAAVGGITATDVARDPWACRSTRLRWTCSDPSL